MASIGLTYAQRKRDVTDILFLPYEGTLASTTSLNKANLEATSSSTARIENLFLEQKLSYSTTDTSAFEVGFTYFLSSEISYSNGLADRENESQIDRLEFNYLYRFYEKNSYAIDFLFGLKPSLGKSRSATATTKGNNRPGGEIYQTGAVLAFFGNEFSYSIGTIFEYNAKTEDTSGLTEKARNDLTLQATLQYTLSEIAYVGAGISREKLGNINQSDGDVLDYDPIFTYSLQYGHKFASNQLLTIEILKADYDAKYLPSTSIAIEAKGIDFTYYYLF